MVDRRGAVSVDGRMSDPTGDYFAGYLLSLSKETPFLDFKWTLNLKDHKDFAKTMKDACAFSNYGAGWIILGVKENDGSDPKIKGKFIRVGLPDCFEPADNAILQEKVNSYLNEPISIHCREFCYDVKGEKRRFAIIYFPPSPKIIFTTKDVKYKDGVKDKIAVHKNITYTRRGTQSIPATEYEVELIEKRLKKETYRLSIISGEPDEIRETIHSNLFEVTSIPQKVYVGTSKYETFTKIIEALKHERPLQRDFQLKCALRAGKIITFENLGEPANIHNQIVQLDSISQESVRGWLADPDKKNLVVYLLNQEVVAKARRQGLRHAKKIGLYYPLHDDDTERTEEWETRYKSAQKKTVAKKIKNSNYLHFAVKTEIMLINNKPYLKLNITMVVTKDGKTPITGLKEGAVITKRMYRTYNKAHLNGVLFWIDKLVGKQGTVSKDFTVSTNPVSVDTGVGIYWDIPTQDFKKFIQEFDPRSEQEYEDHAEEEIHDL